jgi:hypothetical protein
MTIFLSWLFMQDAVARRMVGGGNADVPRS